MKYLPKTRTKSRKRKSWLESEDQILLTHFKGLQYTRELAAKILPLIPGRTISSVENRLQCLRRTHEYKKQIANQWTESEDAVLIQWGKTLGWRTLEVARRAQQDKTLKNRTYDAIVVRVSTLKKMHGIATRARSPIRWSYDEDEILYQSLESGSPSIKMAQKLKDKLPGRQVSHILSRLKALNQPPAEEVQPHTPKARYDKFAKGLPRSLPLGQKRQALLIAEYDVASAKRYIKTCIGYQQLNLPPEPIAS